MFIGTQIMYPLLPVSTGSSRYATASTIASVNLVAVLRRNSHSASQEKKERERKKRKKERKEKEKKGEEFLLPIALSVSAPYSYL